MIDSASASAKGGAVLAGGSSRRMGFDKATVLIEGRSMLDRCLIAMGGAGLSPLAVIGGEFDKTHSESNHYIDDEWPGEGPLGALITALDHLRTPVVVVLACDLIEPSSDEILRLCELLGHHHAVVPVVEGREQWLHSVWNRDCRQPLRDAFDDGIRSIHAATDGLDILRATNAEPSHYWDADTPGELPPGSHRPGR